MIGNDDLQTTAAGDTGPAGVELAKAVRPLPKNPYVGIRPFEAAEGMLFFGRDGDARMLRDKVFSARLTVLYGPSGIGKSSILRALLIPQLECEDAHAIYFDEWRGEQPLSLLKEKLIGEAARLGVPEAGSGVPSLVDLVRLLIDADGRTVVLVLDQFEEYFVAHGGDPSTLQKELGGLVRMPGLDVRVLLSLREEHLASLEPFRVEVVNLLNSTFRLGPLDLANTHKAIEEPAKLYGVAYQPALLSRLLKDLATESSPGQAASTQPAGTDLPILQLVCGKLWDHRRGASELSLDLYETELDGREGIIRQFLEEVMPSRWSEKRVTARLMQYLAPPDGHKLSFSAGHLSSLTGMPKARVEAELERLSGPGIRVLRSRNYGGDNFLYELWHDSFVRLISPWRDRVLQSAANRARMRQIALLVGLALLGGIAIHLDIERRDQSDLYANTVAPWQSKGNEAQKFTDFATYLLSKRQGPEYLDLLKKELQARESQIPGDYGVDLSGRGFALPPQGDWPFTLNYAQARHLKEEIFLLTWQPLAKYLIEKWGIPVPLKVRFATVDTYPGELVVLNGRQFDALELDMPLHEHKVMIGEAGLSTRGRVFLERFQKEWEKVPVKQGGPWWVVPRWSLPVWRASGITATDGSGIPAFRLAIALQDNPDRMLTRDATELLLERVAEKYPQTVAEARMARGDKLGGDFQQVVREGQGLVGLPVLLDLLAGYPEIPSAQAGTSAASDSESAKANLPVRLHGPHKKGEDPAGGADKGKSGGTAIHAAYREAAQWLTPIESPVRLYLGTDLQAAWFTPQGALKPELLEAIQKARDDMLRRTGVLLPGLRVTPDDLGTPANGFRIESLNQNDSHPDAAPIAAGAIPLDLLYASLLFRAESYRVHFITAESVEGLLATAKPELRSWLLARYSLTDLKLMLRGVVNPTNAELASRTKTAAAGALDKSSPMVPGQTIRHPDWLLESLVFWAHVRDPLALGALVEDLRNTERARLARPAWAPRPASGATIEAGLRALTQGEIAAAEGAFKTALAADRAGAIAWFTRLHAETLPARVQQRLATACQRFWTPHRSDAERLDLEEFLNDPEISRRVDSSSARRLGLCLLASYPESFRGPRRELAARLTLKHPSPDQWPTDEAIWIGMELMRAFDPLADDPSKADVAFGFVNSALARLEASEATKKVLDVVDICLKSPLRWCWDRLPTLAKSKADPAIERLIAYLLVSRETRRDIDAGLALADAAKGNLQRHPGGDATEAGSWLDFIRAQGLMRLARYDSANTLDEPRQLFLKVRDSPNVGAAAHEKLITLYAGAGDVARAKELLDHAIRKWPGDPSIQWSKLRVSLQTGDVAGVSQVAVGARNRLKESPEDLDMRYLAAIAFLMAESGPWEQVSRELLATDHQYVPYVAMILFYRMKGAGKEEARAVVERYWSDAAPAKWNDRLNAGDAKVWREMLIGYYLEKLPRDRVFGDLEDPARFAASPLQKVPMHRLGMLCEGYFYEALLAHAKGDQAQFRTALQKVLDTGMFEYHEYSMAAFLLGRSTR